MSKQPRLACLGDLTLDIVVRAKSAAEAGTDVPGTIQMRVGGSAANTARSFAALGGNSVFIGAVGDDGLGSRLTAALRSAGITVHAPRVRGRSARLVALIAGDGERSFITDRGVADSLAPGMLKRGWLSGVDVLHIPAYSLLSEPLAEAAFAAAGWAHAAGALVSVDLASRRPLLGRGRRAARELVGRAAPDVLFANEGEAAALVGRSDLPKLLEIAPIVVIKQGGMGCRVLWRPGSGRRPEAGRDVQSTVATKRIATTDSTGAGDAFDAGFLHSLIESGYRPGVERDTADRHTLAVLRRAALAGHRGAARLLSAPRKELRV